MQASKQRNVNAPNSSKLVIPQISVHPQVLVGITIHNSARPWPTCARITTHNSARPWLACASCRPGAAVQTCILQAGCDHLPGDTPWDDACRQASNAMNAPSSSKLVIPQIAVHPQLLVGITTHNSARPWLACASRPSAGDGEIRRAESLALDKRQPHVPSAL